MELRSGRRGHTVRDVSDVEMTVAVAHPVPGTALIAVSGEVDMLSTPTLLKMIEDQVAAGPQRLIIDMAAVTFMGTSGLAVLVEALSMSRVRGIDLRLVCATAAVRRPLELAGLITLFQVTATASEALERTAHTDPA
jgi:anti-sigma B factor antagonist